MATRTPTYPFLPKSNGNLLPGMIWDIPLRDGTYACGRILSVGGEGRSSRFFIWGGLLAWHDSTKPTVDSIAGAEVLWQGNFDLRSLAPSLSMMLGHLPLEVDGLVIPPILTSVLNGEVMIGYEETRKATDEEFRTLPVKNIWEDQGSFRKLAEAVFLDGKSDRILRRADDNSLLDALGMKRPADLQQVGAKMAKEWYEGRRSKSVGDRRKKS